MDIKDFFEEAANLKNQRGENYDNGGKSAYEIALDAFPDKCQKVVGVWPILQKASRLVTIVTKDNLDKEALHDTAIDLVNYTAMFDSEMSGDNERHENAELNSQVGK
ncbi:hypothetical protein [Lactobacillus sp.]|uniref:hypothetical protein n=1 Tax=Lactobacillus sp. TaxID=1591 RepID=UPI0019A8C5A0|nr:hypothetical protein [Lactobacillus sp.]MBD5429697.1 hypothetical protein [Lactobacillus sp.]